MFGAQYQYVGLDTERLQLLYRVLCRLGLQLAGCCEVGYIGEVYAEGVAAELELELAYTLHVGQRFDVAHSTTNLGDDEVELRLGAERLHVALDFVGDVGYHLYSLAVVLAATLTVDNTLVDTSCSDVVGLGHVHAEETLVVAEVEVSFVSVNGHVAFAVLVGVERTGVDVDIRVELLDCHIVATCLQQFTY